MALSKEVQYVLACTVSGWFENFAGTSALDVKHDLSLDHSLIADLGGIGQDEVC